MINVCPFDQCTSCAACANVCPRSCITMVADKHFGHYKPLINQSLCVDCGLCQKTCPQTNPVGLHHPITAFAAWSKDLDDYHTSTSGAASSVMATYVIKQEGVVYGCAITDSLQPKHVRIDQEEDLYKIKGSKYVQSKIDEDLFCKVKEDLTNGRKVLFLGTPCQNAGLKSYLKKDYGNLLRVDIICHGVPSWKVLKEHIADVADINEVKCYRFRSNKGYVLSLLDFNFRDIYSSKIQDDKYYLGFIKSLYYSEVCYSCKYACAKRNTDLTIGDFWGLGELKLKEKHTDGISVVIPNTQKGVELFNQIKDSFHCEERTVKEAIIGNKQLRFPSSKAIGHSLMRFLYPRLGLRSAYTISFGLQDKFYKLVYWIFDKR